MMKQAWRTHLSRFSQLAILLVCPGGIMKLLYIGLPLLGLAGFALASWLGMGELRWILLFGTVFLLCYPLLLPLMLRHQLYNKQLLLLPDIRLYGGLLAQTGPVLAVLMLTASLFAAGTLAARWPILVYLWAALCLWNYLAICCKLWQLAAVVAILAGLMAWPALTMWWQLHWQSPALLGGLWLSGMLLSWQICRTPLWQPDRGSLSVSGWLFGFWQGVLHHASSLAGTLALMRGDDGRSINRELLIWWVLVLLLFGPAWFSHAEPGAQQGPTTLNYIYSMIAFSTLSSMLVRAGRRLALLWWYGGVSRSQLLAQYEKLALRALLLMSPALLLFSWLALGQVALALQAFVFGATLAVLCFYLHSCLLRLNAQLGFVVLLPLALLLCAGWLLREQPAFYGLCAAILLCCWPLRRQAARVIPQLDFAALLQEQKTQWEQQHVFFKSGR